MSYQTMTLKKLADFLGKDLNQLQFELNVLIKKEEIPSFKKIKQGISWQYVYDKEDLPKVLSKIGFFKKNNGPIALTVFTTKGGVLKTTLGLNLARVAALHGLSVCVVGLDMQGDMTNALGVGLFSEDEIEEKLLGRGLKIDQIAGKIDSTKGLYDFYKGEARLDDIIEGTDLENLFLIPETPELVALNDHLANLNRREYWLKEKVVKALKSHFDLVILDCSPNWNRLTTNALVASDILLSPLECKINNFRNFKVFAQFLNEFQDEMNLNLKKVFIPTRYVSNRRLGLEIRQWYEQNVPGLTKKGIPECVTGEEASALNLSVLEHAPQKAFASELRELLIEIQNAMKCNINTNAEVGAHWS